MHNKYAAKFANPGKTASLNRLAFLVVLILSVAIAGCGKKSAGPETVIVNGTVTFDGQPIANGEIRFRPATGTTGFNSGGPIKDGQYTVSNKGGVPVGRHKVVIYAYTTDQSQELPAGSPDTAGAAELQYIPQRYNDKTELTATVNGDEDPQTIDFSLQKSEN